ncbi:Vacuolar cation/proton exchanger 3 (Ca(2+)/H(+) exchanger 3) (OsCAX3) [Durusdinium trenchii]|uniref:Vacuolar cation/proton exchanger 3 (Ca(2+)/H(+) exchanger 3) (OsCAX3) n=1 Tax=Durusdinium trenchii TaxID=1381693 RepID=A0ABP0KKG0_9DINO
MWFHWFHHSLVWHSLSRPFVHSRREERPITPRKSDQGDQFNKNACLTAGAPTFCSFVITGCRLRVLSAPGRASPPGLSSVQVFIAALSQWIVDTIEGAAASLGMHILFISGILVPIVGNAAEHAAAVVFAYRNKMEIALGSAVGSAVQISVFVIPLCVVIGWMMDKPMTMNFHIFETSTMLLTSVSIAIILMDGKANWLKGTMLILGYCIIGAGFWAHADPDQMS